MATCAWDGIYSNYRSPKSWLTNKFIRDTMKEIDKNGCTKFLLDFVINHTLGVG